MDKYSATDMDDMHAESESKSNLDTAEVIAIDDDIADGQASNKACGDTNTSLDTVATPQNGVQIGGTHTLSPTQLDTQDSNDTSDIGHTDACSSSNSGEQHTADQKSEATKTDAADDSKS